MPKYETPKKGNFGSSPWSLDSLVHEFGLLMDYAATESNRCLLNYISEEQDALKQKWVWNGWLNPPYENQKDWVSYAVDQVIENRITMVMLLWAHPEARYYRELLMGIDKNNEPIELQYESEVRWICGKVRYWENGSPAKDRAFFPSSINIVRPKNG